MNFEEVTIFGDKTLADVFKEIHNNQQNVSIQIEEVIADLKEKVESISDATILAPIIKDYLDTTVKNNDTLIKMASIIEKTMKSQVDEGGDEMLGFTEEEFDKIKEEIELTSIQEETEDNSK